MNEAKKPDNVVYNPVSREYDAGLRPYATSLGAPQIIPSDTLAWKNRSISKINQKVQTRFLELKAEYDKMLKEFEHNKLIYDASFNFEPLIGSVYHLYKRENGETFLSIIAPDECNFNALGSFYLNSEQLWEKV